MSASSIAGITEHQPLVAGPLLHAVSPFDPLVDIRRLLVDGREHAARFGLEHIVGMGVADSFDHAADGVLNIDIGVGFDFAADDDEARGTQRLASDFRFGVVAQKFVEDGVRNLVGHFVGVPFRHRFRGEQV